MGADIHVYVEKKVEEEWRPVKGLNPWTFLDIRHEKLVYADWAYHRRNYHLFAFLADVRNYGNEIEPMDDPRGLPTDVSPFIKKEAESWGWDGHSHSWFTLTELKAVEKETWYEIDADFFEKTIPKLETLAEEDDDSVRIVFWFDN